MVHRCFLCGGVVWPWQRKSVAEYYDSNGKLKRVFMHDDCLEIFFNLAKMIKECKPYSIDHPWLTGKAWVNPEKKILVIFDDYRLEIRDHKNGRVYEYSSDHIVYRIMKKVVELLPDTDEPIINFYHKRLRGD